MASLPDLPSELFLIYYMFLKSKSWLKPLKESNQRPSLSVASHVYSRACMPVQTLARTLESP